ncbi:MAG: hypothetical protein A3I29_01395 [Candidatus Magasanikbacteria bacterium RIFCSPLOWO2_02_FULL_44_11]|uniref:Uncharacterized protein n=1 Tax=Candidatus Magasanikbacteria bacterium RIFCSPLOWO2_02_FULL_44_11 TaxID=1798689 RepID=A0A1F6N8V5_9BACT|nr:MAG: hypothetical protein A3I29_01395 [Candidatus Magasanikbacteria bacterium RIFCSPLOWO2_02_FULL_44_11]
MRPTAVRKSRREQQMSGSYEWLEKPQEPIVRDLDFLTRQVLGGVEERVRFLVGDKVLFTSLSGLRQKLKDNDFLLDVRTLPFYEKNETNGFTAGVQGTIRTENMRKYFLDQIDDANDLYRFAKVETHIFILSEIFARTELEDLFLDLVVALVDASTKDPGLH